MIPLFPRFKRLDLSDKSDIESFTQLYPPYSDHNFTGLWSYDTENLTQISQLNGNLVIKAQDYTDLLLFYTLLGVEKIDATIQTLLQLTQTQAVKSYLKLVPESVVEKIANPSQFLIQKDRDNFDYIIDADQFVALEGHDFHSKRKDLNHFLDEHRDAFSYVPLNLADDHHQKDILGLFNEWNIQAGKDAQESIHELRATLKIFSGVGRLNLHAFGIRISGKLVAYLIAEVVHDSYAVLHFGKWDYRYKGIGTAMQHHSIEKLRSLGCHYINFEQDLGIVGLRNAKELCNPAFYLEKYTISALP